MWVGERVLIWRNWAEDGEAWRWRIGEDRAQAGCNGMWGEEEVKELEVEEEEEEEEEEED